MAHPNVVHKPQGYFLDLRTLVNDFGGFMRGILLTLTVFIYSFSASAQPYNEYLCQEGCRDGFLNKAFYFVLIGLWWLFSLGNKSSRKVFTWVFGLLIIFGYFHDTTRSNTVSTIFLLMVSALWFFGRDAGGDSFENKREKKLDDEHENTRVPPFKNTPLTEEEREPLQKLGIELTSDSNPPIATVYEVPPFDQVKVPEELKKKLRKLPSPPAKTVNWGEVLNPEGTQTSKINLTDEPTTTIGFKGHKDESNLDEEKPVFAPRKDIPRRGKSYPTPSIPAFKPIPLTDEEWAKLDKPRKSPPVENLNPLHRKMKKTAGMPEPKFAPSKEKPQNRTYPTPTIKQPVLKPGKK